MKLTLAKVAELAKQDIREFTALEASNKDIDDLDDLSVCVELKKVNLSKNALKTLDGLTYCTGLTFLNISENQIETLAGLHKLGLLAVLNASKNSLTHIEGIARLGKLKALILNDNKLKRIPHLAKLAELNTLVVSKNEIEDLGPVRTLRSLTKLSASHNGIIVIPDLSDLHDLGELRLNDNKILTIPDTIHLNFNLKILELGNNRIAKLSDLEILAKMPNLKQLTLKGNPVAKEPGYKKKIADMIPSLEVLDGERFRGKKLHRILYMKQKKAEAEGKPFEIPGKKGAKHDQKAASDQSECAAPEPAPTNPGHYKVRESGKANGHDGNKGVEAGKKGQHYDRRHVEQSDQSDRKSDHQPIVSGIARGSREGQSQGWDGKQKKSKHSQKPAPAAATPASAVPTNSHKPDKHKKQQERQISAAQTQHGKSDSKKRPAARDMASNDDNKKAKVAANATTTATKRDAGGNQPQPPSKKQQADDSGVLKVVSKKHTPKVEDVSSLFSAAGDADLSLGGGGDSAWD